MNEDFQDKCIALMDSALLKGCELHRKFLKLVGLDPVFIRGKWYILDDMGYDNEIVTTEQGVINYIEHSIDWCKVISENGLMIDVDISPDGKWTSVSSPLLLEHEVMLHSSDYDYKDLKKLIMEVIVVTHYLKQL